MQTVKFWWDKFLFQLGSGAPAMILRDGITRAPCIQIESAEKAAERKLWCEQVHNFDLLKHAFDLNPQLGLENLLLFNQQLLVRTYFYFSNVLVEMLWA